MFGPTLSGYLADKAGLHLSWWVYALAAWLLVAVLGVLRVDLNGRVLGCCCRPRSRCWESWPWPGWATRPTATR
jgi:hypothetical protein